MYIALEIFMEHFSAGLRRAEKHYPDNPVWPDIYHGTSFQISINITLSVCNLSIPGRLARRTCPLGHAGGGG